MVIRLLHRIAKAQDRWVAGGEVDVDADGSGEFGTFGELGGIYAARGQDEPVRYSYLPRSMFVSFGEYSEHLVLFGFVLCCYLPIGEGGAISGSGTPLTADQLNADLQEVTFAVYAWPMDLGVTGKRAFVIGKQGRCFATENLGLQRYDGFERMPTPEAAVPVIDTNVHSGTRRPESQGDWYESEFVEGAPTLDGGSWYAVGQ